MRFNKKQLYRYNNYIYLITRSKHDCNIKIMIRIVLINTNYIN